MSKVYVNTWAVSIFTSKTAVAGAITIVLGFLSLPTTLALIPLTWMPTVLMLEGGMSLVLRYITSRPVALIAPGEMAVVRVPKLEPPAPLLTD